MRNLAYRILAMGLFLAASLLSATAQWTAINDHMTGTGTSPNATIYNVYGFTNNETTGFPGPQSGPLKNIQTGAVLPVTLTITNYSLPTGGGTSGAPGAGTPAYTNFNGLVNFGNGGSIWHAIIIDADAVVGHVFSNLVPGGRYRFVGTAVRGEPTYTNRWTLATLQGASSFVSAHSAGVLTTAQVPALAANQAALNAGFNTSGDIFVWDRIVAPANGTIAVVQSKYSGAVPGGVSDGTTSYAIFALKFEEIDTPLSIVSQPQPTTVCLGGTATLTVGVTGSAPFYQWRKDGVNIPNATNASLVIPNAAAGNAGNYSVVITNTLSSLTSATVSLQVSSVALTLLGSAPTNAVIGLGSNAVFTATPLAGSQPITYQWYSNVASNNTTGTLIAGATNRSLTVPNVTLSTTPYYYAVVSNCVGIARSRVALLTPYVESIVITAQPQDVTTTVGANATFAVTATGSALRYQWYKVGATNTPILNATNRTLTLNNLQIANSGLYFVRVYNVQVSVDSSTATLVVNSPPYLAYAFNGTNSTGVGTNFWRYDQSGTDKSTAWKEFSYPAADSWPQGRGLLGFEDNGAITPLINTTLTRSNNNTQVRTFYFRTTFVITNDPTTVQVIASNLVDDGAVYWVNGVEVGRFNMPAGVINYRTLSPAAATENSWNVFTVPGSRLLEGTNVMAVEVHQTSDTSTDLIFGQALFVGFPAWTAVQITNQPHSLIVEEAKPAAFTAEHAGGPAYYQWYKWVGNNAVAITGNPTARRQTFVISNALTSDAGFYFVTISNIVSYTVSSNAQLVIIPDTNAPMMLQADGTESNTNVLITFSEEVRLGTAPNSLTNTANYTVTNTHGGNATVRGAVFLPPNQVKLWTTARAVGSNWIATAKVVTDVSPRANTANNIAAPISTYLNLIGLGEQNYSYNQPIFGIDPNPAATFNNLGWTLLTYNEAADPNLAGWGEGPSAFHRGPWEGYEMQAPEGANISQNDQITGVYVRKRFNFTASPAGLEMTYRYSVADGAVFYLNGQEYDRFQMPAGQPTIFTAATAQGGTYSAPVWSIPTTDYLPLPASFVNYGSNIFASEFHGVTAAEIAQAFAAELRARIDSYVVGKVVITRPPTNVTVFENDVAYFEPASAGGRSFRWFSNNVALANGTNPVYTIARTPLGANGSRFKCTITGATDSQTTAEALLTVLPDTNAPVLLGAYYTGANTVSLYFSEPVNAADAVTRAYYYVTNGLTTTNAIPISNVQLLNGTNAIITFSSALPLGNFTVVVSQIRDLATTPNKIATNSPVTVGLQNYALVTFSTNDLWRYTEGGVDLGTAWRGRNFNDTAWPSGGQVFDGKTGATDVLAPRAAIGGLPVGTQLTSLTQNPNIPTIYFRKSVNVPVFGPGATMTIRHILDDGAAFYVNSNLCYAIGVGTPTAYGSYATVTIGDAAIEGPFAVPTTNLIAGNNVIAAELKDVNATSSDITFGAELILNVPSLVLPPGGPTTTPVITNVPPLRIVRQGTSNVSVSWTNTGAALTLQYSTNMVLGGSSTWLNVPNQANPYVVPTTTNLWRYFRLRNP